MNSRATSVTRLRLHRSAVVGWFVLWREIYHRAILDFCNTICQLQTSPYARWAVYNVCASAASAQRTSLCWSPHKLKLARLPGFGEEWLERAVEPQDREPTLAGRGLNPVAALHTVGLRRAEVDRR